MVVINLYGALEYAAQRSTKLYVKTFEEAMKAMMANFPKLAGMLRKTRVSVLIDGKMMTFEDALRPYKGERIDIMPIVGGTGPAIMIVVGAIMTYGPVAGMIGTLLSGITGIAAATITASVAQFGMAMIIGGISQLLFKPPKPMTSERPETTPSYSFNGAINTNTQGNVVPVGFGRMRVGSQVISANVQTWDIPVAPSSAPPPPAPPPALPAGVKLGSSHDFNYP